MEEMKRIMTKRKDRTKYLLSCRIIQTKALHCSTTMNIYIILIFVLSARFENTHVGVERLGKKSFVLLFLSFFLSTK